MSRLLDGPAGPFAMANARAPIFLRVTLTGDELGRVTDCLDQLEDVAKPYERIHVYQLVPGTFHGATLVCVRGRGGSRSYWMADGEYRHRPDVDGETLRDNDAWRTWCLAQPEAVAVAS